MIYSVYGIEEETQFTFEQDCYSQKDADALASELTSTGYTHVLTENRMDEEEYTRDMRGDEVLSASTWY
jgi:hypothetical protein